MLSTTSSHESPKSVVVIGLGGLGLPILWEILTQYKAKNRADSALQLAPISLTLIEHDSVERSNLNRQVLFTDADVGRSKADATASGLAALALNNSDVPLRFITERLSLDNINQHLQNAHLVLEATDSVSTKLLVNDYCVANGIPFIYGGVTGTGGVALFVPRQADGRTACLRCLFGEFTAEDERSLAATCRRAGIFGPLAAHVGFLQGKLALQYLTDSDNSKSNSTLLRFSFDSLKLSENIVEPDSACPLGCGESRGVLLNLKGERCPRTFLYTKLALEKLHHGQVLDVRYDSAESAHSVHESVLDEGYISLSEPRQLYRDNWQLLIKKPIEVNR